MNPAPPARRRSVYVTLFAALEVIAIVGFLIAMFGESPRSSRFTMAAAMAWGLGILGLGCIAWPLRRISRRLHVAALLTIFGSLFISMLLPAL